MFPLQTKDSAPVADVAGIGGGHPLEEGVFAFDNLNLDAAAEARSLGAAASAAEDSRSRHEHDVFSVVARLVLDSSTEGEVQVFFEHRRARCSVWFCGD